MAERQSRSKYQVDYTRTPTEKGVETPKSPKTTLNASKPTGDTNLLDLVFACDCTSSMGQYLDSAKRNITKIIEDITASEKADVLFSLVQYRDHPPQDTSFVTRTSKWTNSVREMKKYVNAMYPQGGGDGPEAVTAALDEVNKLCYRKGSARVCVLIADAPPHGIEPPTSHDGFPDGPPSGLDALDIVRKMADNSIVIYAVGVEPNLGHYTYARDFMSAIAKMTDGKFLPLTSASLLPGVIIGGSAEEIALNKIEDTAEEKIEQIMAKNKGISQEECLKKLTIELQKSGVQTKQLHLDDIYGSYDNTNVNRICEAKKLTRIHTNLKKGLNAHVADEVSKHTSHRGYLRADGPSAPSSTYGGRYGSSGYGSASPSYGGYGGASPGYGPSPSSAPPSSYGSSGYGSSSSSYGGGSGYGSASSGYGGVPSSSYGGTAHGFGGSSMGGGYGFGSGSSNASIPRNQSSAAPNSSLAPQMSSVTSATISSDQVSRVFNRCNRKHGHY